MTHRFSRHMPGMIFLILALVVSCAGPQIPPLPIPQPVETLSVQAKPEQDTPQLLAQSPVQGQRLDLEAAIEIQFDRDMEAGKTADSFTFLAPDEEPVPGRLTWLDSQTLSFQPDKKLVPATSYTALITNPTGLDGVSTQESVRLEFKTVEALAVGQVFPAPEADSVDPGTTITVIFNRPITPVVIEEEQPTLPQPLELSPAVEGAGEWLNSSVYVFQPEKPLISGTRYTARVDADLLDVTGNFLEEPFLWQFTTRAPVIISFGLKSGLQNPTKIVENVLLDQSFLVSFLQPMDAGSVAKAVTISNRETGKPFPLRLKWNKEFTSLTIEPAGRFEIGSFYQLSIAETAQAQDGAALREGKTLLFNTVSPPGILNVDPAPNSKPEEYRSWFRVDFASPMKVETLKTRVRITPAPEGELNIYYNDNDWQLYVYGLKPATDYVVRLLPGMTDIYGNAIQTEYSFTFTSPDMTPYARLALPWTPLVYRAEGPQEVFFEHTNLNSAQISLHALSYVEFSRMLKGDLPATNFKPDRQPVRVWAPDVQTVRNQTNYQNIVLEDPKGNALAPGYYFLGLQGAPLEYEGVYYQGFLFIVATDHITFKATSTEGMAWVTDLESGKPQADLSVTFYDAKFIRLGEAKTDQDGLARLDGNAPLYAQVNGTGRLAFTALDWGSGASAGDFGLYENYYDNRASPFAYLYTDRPLYRPGQDVYFKGFVRKNDDLHYSLPAKTKVFVTIDHWGEQVYAQDLTLSELGSFNDSFRLSDQAALGTYDIYVRFAGEEDIFGRLSFRVAEYHKPEFQVRASTDPAQTLAGNSVNFNIDAAYYSGGNVANADVEWFLESSPYIFTPSNDYQHFSFMDWDRDSYWAPQTAGAESTINEGQAVTDEGGHFSVGQTLKAESDSTTGAGGGSQLVTFNANVTDVGGNLVSGSASVIVHQSEVYAGIRSERYIGKAGEPQSFEIITLDWASEPVPNQEITVKFIERKWYSVQEKDKQGQLRWVTSVEEIPAGTQTAVTDGKGLAVVSFTPPNGGTFKAIVSVEDAKRHTHQASAYTWVSSNEYIAWRQTNDRTFNLVADQENYEPGDTAELLIAQPFPEDVYALVTYERGHIYKQEVVLLHGNSTVYKLPITGDMAPMAYISVVVVSGAGKENPPDFKVGMTRINVNTSQQSLTVKVTSDKETSGPGEQVTYTITTKDPSGQPAQAEVSLAVVDKAALALAPSNSASLLSSFYPQQALGVRTALGLVSSADDFNAMYRKSIPEGGGSGGGGGGEPDLGIVTVRQDFKDTAHFEALVMTDENGQARVTVNLPENLTTWQADARAVTADSKVGQATNEVMSTKPLFVEMTTPRFFVVGDQSQVGAVIHNNTTSSIKVSVELKTQGAALESESSQTATVEAKGQAYVTWNLMVQDFRRVDFTVRASGGGYQDASKPALGTLEDQGIPVYTYTAMETIGTSGILQEANSITEGLRLPQTLNYSDARLSVEVAPSLAASMQSGLEYLEDFDYLCMEQTISRFLPNVITTRALKTAGLEDPALKEALDEQVNTALQRIYAKQLYDGGWHWWDGDQSDPYVTAYVVYGLLEARESGYPVAEGALNAGFQYLKDNLQNIASRGDLSLAQMRGGGGGGLSTSWENNRYVFMMYMLARGGELGTGEPNGIYAVRESLSLYAKAYLTQTLYLLDPEDERIDSIMSDLGAAAILSSSGAHWEEAETDVWNWNTDTRTTAIVLNTFTQVNPTSPITANAVRWLMAHRTSGRWRSTQETVWSLIALTNWLTVSKEFETSYQYAVGLNGETLEQGQASRDNLTETIHLQVELKDLLKDEVNYLVFTRGDGEGNLYYTAMMSAALPVNQIQPLDQGISLAREYFRLDDTQRPINEIERGELVRVRLTMVVPAALHYVVIDDPLPAGLEAVDSSLDTSAEVPLKYTRADYTLRGWGWWYFTHKEFRDEKVTLSASYLPAGTYVYTYLARASTPGTFQVIPPAASEFYFPDVGGRGAGSTFTITP